MESIRIDELRFDYDSADPDGFRAGMARLGPRLGAGQSGVTIYELPPGQAVCRAASTTTAARREGGGDHPSVTTRTRHVRLCELNC